mmetsp:Transcript_880/g.1574  ORF Transcript_880/g.1574 Transcript_880/m.1574 type:complete len:320 (+) Transcript_880:177-1136(+)
MARFALSALLLLAVVVGNSAFSTDPLLDEAAAEAQRALFKYELPSKEQTGLSSAGRPMMMKWAGMVHDMEPSCECKNCTRGSAHWVMDHVISYLKEKCETTECPYLKKKCDMAAKHPKVTFGYLFAAVRPVSLGYAWCNGKGVCGKDSDPELSVDELSVGDSMDQLQKLVGESESDLMSEMVEKVQAANVAGAVAEGIDALINGADEDEANTICKGCIKVTSMVVFWETVGKIKHFCKTTKSEMVKKHCDMAKKHPQEAFGYLAYKLRPGEWACGYCFGNKMCGDSSAQDTFQDDVLFQLAGQADGFTFADEETVTAVY